MFSVSNLFWLVIFAQSFAHGAAPGTATASSSQPGFFPTGVVDHDRFSFAVNHAWKGKTDCSNWWWEIEFPKARKLGAILQIQGDHEFVFQNAPKSYSWQTSLDGNTWQDLQETRIDNERRLFRLHRLTVPRRARFVRLQITAAESSFPTIREVEFFTRPREHVRFPNWIIAVNTTHDPHLPNEGKQFIPLAKSCAGQGTLQAQQVWLDSFDEKFCATEPKPLCAFLSGNFKDWCEVQRTPWRGTEQILKKGHLPLWASCGGAQGLAILATVTTEKLWDCPHCRDPQDPKTPIYTHIGHTGNKPCGDYSSCIFERGPHMVQQITRDPVFKGLPDQFQAMQSHCGQIEWPPPGWELIVTAGPGTQTRSQCLKLKSHCIYAAQFHIEMEGTPETSRQIMSNFLRLAKHSGGYRPEQAK